MRATPWLLAAPALCCIVAFVVAPILCVGAYSFAGRDTPGFTLANWHEFFTDPFYSTILLDTIRLATTTTFICATLGYGPAIYLLLQPPRRRALLVVLLFLPSWISYIVRTMSWLPILGKSGLINQLLLAAGLLSHPLPLLYNNFSIYVGLVQFLLPLMIINVFIGLQSVDPSLVSAARTLGANPLQAFRRIVLPLSLPGLAAGCLLCFILSMGSYVTPMVLGGPGATFYANLVYDTVLTQQDWPFGATLSLVVVIFLLLALILYGRFIGLKNIFNEVRA
jgi:spermidine/putrescine transport system permease protein